MTDDRLTAAARVYASAYATSYEDSSLKGFIGAADLAEKYAQNAVRSFFDCPSVKAALNKPDEEAGRK